MTPAKHTKFLVTGGAGFTGAALAGRLLARGGEVVVYDNFERPGAGQNARRLAEQYGRQVTVVRGDIRSPRRLAEQMQDAGVVFHLAARSAGPEGDPEEYFEVNARGTLNLLEAARALHRSPIVCYSSTSRVYGTRRNPRPAAENEPLDMRTHFACSKGAGDQYTADYARTYGLRTIVFRQSCIYGQGQSGAEEQGWVARYAIRAMAGLPVTIHGDGRQVRDVLYIDDLIAVYEAAIRAPVSAAGQVYNIGGGPRNTLSPLDLIALLESHIGCRIEVRFEPPKPDCPDVFVTDIDKARRDFGWEPRVPPAEGVRRLVQWLKTNQDHVAASGAATAREGLW
jgi:CDP-paratose 2-epimerase